MDLMQYMDMILKQLKHQAASGHDVAAQLMNNWDRQYDQKGGTVRSDSNEQPASIAYERTRNSPAATDDKYWQGSGNWDMPQYGMFKDGQGLGTTYGNSLDQMPDANPRMGSNFGPNIIRNYR